MKVSSLIDSSNEILRKLNHLITTWPASKNNRALDIKDAAADWYDEVTGFLAENFPDQVSWFQNDTGAYDRLNPAEYSMRSPPEKAYRMRALMEHRVKRLRQIAMPDPHSP